MEGTAGRVCAIAFMDGPCMLPAMPDRFRGKPLTLVLAETLERYGAKGTFAVVGDTSDNYRVKTGGFPLAIQWRAGYNGKRMIKTAYLAANPRASGSPRCIHIEKEHNDGRE